MTALTEWVKRCFFLSMFTGCVLFLIPDGKMKKGMKILCSFALLLTVISVIPIFDGEMLPELYAKYRKEAESITNDGSTKKTLVRSVIEEQLEAYIQEKAKGRITLKEVTVVARWSTDGFWYPDEISLRGVWEPEEQNSFSVLLEREFGIAPEHQNWISE